MPRTQNIIFPALVFLVVLAGYWATPISDQVHSDMRWSLHLALSLIREGNLDLDEYGNEISPDDYAILNRDGHRYSYYPIGTPVYALPFVAAYYAVKPDLATHLKLVKEGAQTLVASVTMALVAVLIYLMARFRLGVGGSLLVALVFAFGTSAWSTASRALWQHGPTMLCMSLAITLLLAGRRRPGVTPLAALPLAFSYFIRPMNALLIIALTFVMAVCYRRYFVRFVLAALVVALPLFGIIYATYGTLTQPVVYDDLAVTFLMPGWDALAGLLISPSRGLFVWMPVLLFSLWGMALKLRDARRHWPESALDVALALMVFAYYLVTAAWFMWWGGYSLGPRLLVDLLPALMYFLVPAIERLQQPGRGEWVGRGLFAGCVLFGFGVQALVVQNNAAWEWNYIPIVIDDRPSWVWNWRDAQFLRGLTLYTHAFPPSVTSLPQKVHLRCRVGEPVETCKTTLEMVVAPWQALDFRFSAPPEMRVKRLKSEPNNQRPQLMVQAIDTNRPAGVYPLGAIKLAAAPKGSSLWGTTETPVVLELTP